MLDAIIAAAALSEHAVLITRNVRHFQFSELELLVPEDTAGR